MTMKAVHVIGAPLDLGGGRRGVDMGPSAFRVAGLADRITRLGYAVVDRGNVPTPIPETQDEQDQRKKYIHDIARVCGELYAWALGAFAEDAIPLVLGGDHSIAAGSVAAAAEWTRRHDRPIGLIWVDAHGDMNTPATSPSGNVHGMPLAALLGSEPHELAEIGGWGPKLSPEHTVLVGIRNLDEQERAAVRNSHVHVLTMKDIDRRGMAVVADEAVRLAGNGTAGIHVSFDMDACDPLVAPGVGTPVRGGLGYREAHLLMEIVADSGLLTSLDVVEVNPTLDLRNTTAEFGTELVLSALGMNIL